MPTEGAVHHRPGGNLAWAARALLLLAAGITVVFAVLLLAAPRSGLVRTFYDNQHFDSTPRFQVYTSDVSLAFMDTDESLPRRSFGVEWRGFWYVPTDRTVELFAGADDSVDVYIDSERVLRRNPKVGMHTMGQRVALPAGSHEIVVRYVQHGGGMGLTVLWSLPHTEPGPLPADALFATPVDRTDVALASARRLLVPVVPVLWAAAVLLTLVARRLRTHPAGLRRAPAPPGTFWRRLRHVAASALLPPVILFVVGPQTVHSANPEEFSVLFQDVIWPWVIGAVTISWAALLLPGMVAALLSERATNIYAAVLATVGLLLWVQGTFLLADYGPLYGETLNLSAHDGRIPYELALWGGVLAAAVVFARRVSAAAGLLSLLFAGLQVAVLLLPTSVSGASDRAQGGWSAPPADIYKLSRSRNILHIVLDGFLSELFGEALDSERAEFDRTFSGFIYFPNHLGAFPTTKASMPAMLTGVAYRNDRPFDEFLSQTVERKSIVKTLAERGFAVRSITFHGREHPATARAGDEIVRYTIPTPYGTYEDYVRFTALQLFDLALFRHVPQLLKERVYNEEAWVWQSWYSGASLDSQRPRMARSSNHAAFLDEFTERLTAEEDAPVYEFIHVAVPHPPLVLDGDCTFVGHTRTSRRSYAAQSRCAVAVVGRLMDRLRALGIYDNTAVVLTADHGWRVPKRDHPLARAESPIGNLQNIALTAMPLLAIKPAAATGPVRISRAPTSITDIPATIADLAGLPARLFPGEPALRMPESADRQRTFAFHTWRNADWQRDYMDALYVFSINGPIHDPRSWTFDRKVADPSEPPGAQ